MSRKKWRPSVTRSACQSAPQAAPALSGISDLLLPLGCCSWVVIVLGYPIDDGERFPNQFILASSTLIHKSNRPKMYDILEIEIEFSSKVDDKGPRTVNPGAFGVSMGRLAQ
jgi:hypothetical protein